MPHMLDPGLIRTFVAVADHGSMTAAANALHLTQGAVSQHVRRLESQLGSDLFERARGGLRMTLLGERLLGKARAMLALNGDIWREVRGGTLSGRLRLGIPADLVGTPLFSAVTAFARAHSDVDLALLCFASPRLKAAISRGELDLAVIEERSGQETGECLAVDRLVWIGAPGGRAASRRPLPLSMVEHVCAFRATVFAALERSGVSWRSSFESGSNEATLAAVRADLAVSVRLAATVPADLAVLPASGFPAPDPSAPGLPDLESFSVTLHTGGAADSPAAREMARVIRAACPGFRLASGSPSAARA